MYSKAQIYNLALGALLLSRQITNTETDPSNECKVLNTHYPAAFASALADMDLDSTSTIAVLALIEEDPNDDWSYAYTYPTDCVFFRRIRSGQLKDNNDTIVDKRIMIHEGAKAILTNQEEAEAEYITSDVPLSALSAEAGIAISLRLAMMSSPLITGKGSKELLKQIQQSYLIAKAEAQEQDRRENSISSDPETESEFVSERMS